ncbi:hypothetical protein ACHQM5_029056 [Ranunculus cassubicifolius]
MAHSFFGVIACVVVLVTLLGGASAQTTHVVLDSSGWSIPTTPNAYTTWAASQTFMVGDILVFNFATGQHDVAQVSKASYDACTSTNVIGSIITNGPANLTLDTAGEHYYICAFNGHCDAGQKLMINVTGSPPTASPPMPSSPSPLPSPPTASSPSPTASSPSPSPSTASPPSPSPSPSTASPPSPSPSPSPSTASPPSPSTASPPMPLPPTSGPTPPMPSTPPPSPSTSTDSPPSTSPPSPPMPPMSPPNSASMVVSASLAVIFLSILLNIIV